MIDKLEQYRDIPNWVGYYQASNLGKIKALARRISHKKYGWQTFRERILKTSINKYGYEIVGLSKNAIRESFPVHRLVCFAWLSNPEHKEEVNHKNFIRHDNRLENLEWCSSSENTKHAYLAGRIQMPNCKGEDCGASKLLEKDVIQIRVLYENKAFSLEDIAEIYDVAVMTIWHIIHRKTWKHVP